MAYRTRHGRRVILGRNASNGIQYLVKLEGTRATFECKRAGHRMVRDYGKGPRHRQVSADNLARMAAYWGLGLQSNGTRGHCYGWCQQCQNATDKASGDLR